MPVPRAVARFQRRFMNPIVRHWAVLLPGYGVVLHTGRRSGKQYRTPLNVFRTRGGFAIVIAYGLESDWLRNVQAARGGTLIKMRKHYLISNPRIVSTKQARAALPIYGKVLSIFTRSPDILLVDATPA